MPELEGQLALFDIGDVTSTRIFRDAKCIKNSERIEWLPWFLDDDEVCEECGTLCTSSKECVELSGLYD